MAGGKETPRQKMIGMMYLVLTAILALNVSKDILDSFIVVNQGLENTNLSFEKKNEILYSELDFQKNLDPLRVTPLWIKAQEAKKLTAEMYAYIEQLKTRLVKETEDLEQNVADTMQLANTEKKDNYDTPTYIMVGDSEDGSEGVAKELKQKLNEYRAKMLALVDKDVQASLQLPINTEDPKNSEENHNWEMHNFYHAPLAASVTILSKLQNDVKNSESEVVSHLLANVDADALKFDTVMAKVIPQSSYVLLGEEYKADVFIAAYSKTQKPSVLVGNYNPETKQFNGAADSLPVDRGQGKYSVPASREGIIKWGGVVSIKSPKGKTLSYPFETEYIVAKPALTVSADKMNVLYMGVNNPISISVPGIPNEKLKPTISSGNMRALGNGKFEVTGVTGTTASVTVTATLDNGETRNMGSISFRVKPLPSPKAKCGPLKESGKMNVNELKVQQGIKAIYENFDFEITPKIVSYSMGAIIRNQYSEASESAKNEYFTKSMKDLIASLRKGDRVFFYNIRAVGPDGIQRTIPDLTITAN
jgi:gliding motility-associated protein GldM